MHTNSDANTPTAPQSKRSSVVSLSSAGSVAASPKIGKTDHVPTILHDNPLVRHNSAAVDLEPGSTLGHFEVIGPLGIGGMATVFKAKDLTLGREVALKILPPTLAVEADAVARFKFEARAAAKLNHDNVSRVFFFGEDRGLHFIAFEFVDGRTLRDLIEESGPLAPSDAVRYMLDTAIGLQHAAEKGVVHRDVKPSNIIITPSGRAKLIDMGLARSVDTQSVNGQVTQSGVTLGTFDYISPEQAIDPRRTDVRSDVYSLGCTFYHALTGRPPVPEGNAARKLTAHQTESPTDPRLINPAIPDVLALVLDRMMAKLPAHRQQTAAELVAELTRVAGELGVKNVQSEISLQPIHANPPSLRLSGAVVSLTIAAIGLLFAGVVLFSVSGGGLNSPAPQLPWGDPLPQPTPPTASISIEPNAARTPSQVSVSTVGELIAAIDDHVPKIILTAGVYDLTDGAGVLVSGHPLVLESPDGDAVLQLTASPPTRAEDNPRPGGITFRNCESVTLKGLRVEVGPGDATSGVGVFFDGVANVEIRECRFTASVTTTNVGKLIGFARLGKLKVQHGFFQTEGVSAVELSAGATAEFTDCGFIVGRTALDLSAGDSLTTVAVTHTTFLLTKGAAAVNLQNAAWCDLTAAQTVFAAPPSAGDIGMVNPDDYKAVVVRASQSGMSTVNIPSDAVSAVYRVQPPVDARMRVLSINPWAPTPSLDPKNPFELLRLNTKTPQVRVTKGDILGVRQWTAQRPVYTPASLSPLVRASEAVWFPKMQPAEKGTYPENYFTDLRDALNYLKGRGTLLIHGRGIIPVPAVVFDSSTRSIILKPDEESAPILTPALGNDRRETTLFRLEAGELKLEGLQLLVKPGELADSAAIVSMSGGKRCDFSRCVLTLEEGSGERSAAVSFADMEKLKLMKGVEAPEVTFDSCLIRGRGRVVRSEVAVSASLQLTNVGVVTELAPAFDIGSPSRDVTLSVSMTNVTAALSGPLLDFRGEYRLDERQQVKLDFQVNDSLFTALDKTSKPLLRLAGLDPTSFERPLGWTSSGGNLYDGWSTFLELQGEDGVQTEKWDAADWLKWTGEVEAAGVGLKMPPVDKLTAEPSDLEPADFTSSGANLKPLSPLFRR